MNVHGQLVFVKQAFHLSVRDMVGVSLLAWNTNPLNIAAHVCIN